MERLKYLAAAGLFLLSTGTFAQKKNFTIAEATNGMSTTLMPKGLKDVSWQPGTNRLYFTANNAWVSMHFPDLKTDTVVRLPELNNTMHSKLKSIPSMKWQDKDYVYYQDGDDIIRGIK